MFDIRGLYPQEINEEFAKTVGKVFSDLYGGPLIIARDCRKSSLALLRVLEKSIPKTINVGEISTPLFYYSVIKSKAKGGIMVTASHLDQKHNGFKLVKKNAIPLTEQEIESLNEAIKNYPSPRSFGKNQSLPHSYENSYKEDIKKNILDKIIVKKLNIKIKTVNKKVREMWKKIWPDGFNNKQKVDYTVLFDSDGDRVSIYEGDNKVLPNEYLAAMIAKLLLKLNPGKKIIGESRFGFLLQDAVEENNGELVIVPSWAQNLKFAMEEDPDIIFGAESSGHFIRKDFYCLDDGIVAAISFLQAVSNLDNAVSADDYLIIPEENLPAKNEVTILGKLANYFQDKLGCQVSLLDGLTVVGPNWRFNLRVSLTENKLRFNFQARKEGLSGRKIEEMKPVLYDNNYPTLGKSGKFCNYYMFRGEPSITILLSKMLGKEFNKTLGHFHKREQGETYQIIFGRGMFLLQDRQDKIKIVKAKTGDSVQIPVGYAHTMINIGKTILAVADNSLGSEMNDYLPITEKHGFSYYVIREKSRRKLVKNPAYGKDA